VIIIVNITTSMSKTFASFARRRSWIDETNVVVRTIAVVNHTNAEIDWTTINNCGHSIHFVAAEKWSLNSSSANAIQVDRFDFLCGPIRPEVSVISDGESEWISKFVGNNTRLFCVRVET
jgi:hypothetical protein